MGRRKYSRPRHGSLAYLPRGRARSLLPRVKSWPEGREGPLGFIVYKVGMTSVHFVDNRPGSPTQGSEITSTATVVAAPPLKVVGLSLYDEKDGKLVNVGKVWNSQTSEDLLRRNPTFKPEPGPEKAESTGDGFSEVRLIVATQPRLVGAGKTPHIAEIKIGGKPDQSLKRGLELLGKELKITDVFKEGDFVDAIGVTKGKGFQGVVKRYGVSILQRKSRKTRRGVAAIGPWNPHYVMYTVPRSGQMGYQRRTEYNKRILRISSETSSINPKSGWHRFGLVRTDYAVVEGSLAGTPLRPLVLRAPAKPPKPLEPPQITLLEV
ncbi:MAG: 50S ribosomal protein L3 [Candidatus Caldarchaeum sp.]|nr:50S ribosomal protein L3 [Candidatus Caldarchaeum sp.]MDW8360677.1 50S ribosomal protein L3 [Candidatus Caldarchaeum sp.]